MVKFTDIYIYRKDEINILIIKEYYGNFKYISAGRAV